MLDLRFYNILKANGWQQNEIDNFNNYYDEFLKNNEPDFTLFMNYLYEKGFNKSTSELIRIYTAYKMPIQTKINTNNQSSVHEDEEKKKEEPEQVQGKENIEVETPKVEPVFTDEMKKELNNANDSLRKMKKNLANLEAALKAETDPANKEKLEEKINDYKNKTIPQRFTERMNRLKTKFGSIEAFQRKIVDFDKFYVSENQVENKSNNQTTSQVENKPSNQTTNPVENKPNNQTINRNEEYENSQNVNNLKSINDFKDERTTKWKEKHKKGFILTKLSPKLDVVKVEKPDLFNNLAKAANAVKQAAFEQGVNSEEYQTLARQYMDTQKETLGRMKSWKINRELGKQYILKSGNHIEIPEWLLNMTLMAKTKTK